MKMGVLIIDNYDSFVYNIARYVEELGFRPTVLRNDAFSLEDIAAQAPSHIIISPGPCSPQEAGICLSLIQTFAPTIPLLGICLGHQAIAQAFGGKVVPAQHPMHGKACLIRHQGIGIFAHLPNPLMVARYHSLIADPHTFPHYLHITATDAAGEIMALQHHHYPTFGLQFHPESILTEEGHRFLGNFLKTSS